MPMSSFVQLAEAEHVQDNKSHLYGGARAREEMTTDLMRSTCSTTDVNILMAVGRERTNVIVFFCAACDGGTRARQQKSII